MRILVMVHLYPPLHNAGGEWMIHSMLRPLVARGHQATVLLSRETPDSRPYELDGVRVLPRINKDDPWPLIANTDLVITHLENTPRAVVLSRMTKRPYCLICHNDQPGTRTWLADDASLVVFNSEWLAESLGGHPNGVIVRPPVFFEDYRTTPGDKVTLVNLWEPKGGEVFAELAKRMPDVEFLGVKGAYGEPQIAPRLPNVEILDHIPGPLMAEKVYSRTRILLMPSSYESWGRVGMEAMCSGIPVIAHPTPGLVESLGSAGIFADRTDLNGWERAIRRLRGPYEWQTASKAALTRAAQCDPTEDLDRWVEAVERIGSRVLEAA